MAIIDSIKEQFHSLSVGVGPIGNLYTVFMHDLAIHFTGILMHRESIEHYRDLVEFPLVNKSYALSPYKSEAHKNNTSTHIKTTKTIKTKPSKQKTQSCKQQQQQNNKHRF